MMYDLNQPINKTPPSLSYPPTQKSQQSKGHFDMVVQLLLNLICLYPSLIPGNFHFKIYEKFFFHNFPQLISNHFWGKSNFVNNFPWVFLVGGWCEGCLIILFKLLTQNRYMRQRADWPGFAIAINLCVLRFCRCLKKLNKKAIEN